MIATAPAISTAPAVTTLSAVTSTPLIRRTPTNAADPLGGDPYVDLFGEDSDGDDIPCCQQQNMERLLQLAEELGSQGHTLEDLLAHPITAPAPQPAPGQPPVFDIATLVASPSTSPSRYSPPLSKRPSPT